MFTGQYKSLQKLIHKLLHTSPTEQTLKFLEIHCSRIKKGIEDTYNITLQYIKLKKHGKYINSMEICISTSIF